MKIPALTEEMLARVVGFAASPVVVEWTVAGDRDAALMRKVLESAAEEFDAELIFLRIWIDEHPVEAERRGIGSPTIEVWHRGELVATADEGWDREEVRSFLADIAERARRKP